MSFLYGYRKYISYFRHGAYGYLLAIGAYWWYDNFKAGYFNWVILSLILACFAAMLLRKKWLDKYIGYYLSIASAYMLLAVFSAFTRLYVDDHKQEAIKTIVFGGSMFLLCSLSSISLVVFSYKRDKTPVRS